MRWLRRRAEAPVPPAPEAGESGPPPVASERVDHVERVPSAGRLRRERRHLARRREVEIRDVGGLVLEMARRDRFRPELVLERATEVLSLEHRLHEIDSLLFAAASAPRGLRGVARCECGAPLLPGQHFCSHCGRPVSGTPAVATCGHCGQPLPAEANFCPVCGNSTAAEDLEGVEEFDDTIIRPWTAGEERAGER